MDIDKRGAGREMDALVAEKIMGWTNLKLGVYQNPDTAEIREWYVRGDRRGWKNSYYIPSFSTDIGEAWKVVLRLREMNFATRIEPNRFPNQELVEVWANDDHPDAFPGNVRRGGCGGVPSTEPLLTPLAICRAALKAVAP